MRGNYIRKFPRVKVKKNSINRYKFFLVIFVIFKSLELRNDEYYEKTCFSVVNELYSHFSILKVLNNTKIANLQARILIISKIVRESLDQKALLLLAIY
jgi:hypothetical protein